MILYTVTATDKTDNTQYTHVFLTPQAAEEHIKRLNEIIPARDMDSWDIQSDSSVPGMDDEFLDWLKDYYKTMEE